MFPFGSILVAVKQHPSVGPNGIGPKDIETVQNERENMRNLKLELKITACFCERGWMEGCWKMER